MEQNSDLQPDNDEIPEAYHADFGRCIPSPGLLVLDGDYIHEMQDKFHSQEGRQESQQVA